MDTKSFPIAADNQSHIRYAAWLGLAYGIWTFWKKDRRFKLF